MNLNFDGGSGVFKPPIASEQPHSPTLCHEFAVLVTIAWLPPARCRSGGISGEAGCAISAPAG